MNYPEHQKLKAIKDQSQAVHDFIEWLQYEKKIRLPTKMCALGVPKLIAEFFEIDMNKISKEKDQMLVEMRAVSL